MQVLKRQESLFSVFFLSFTLALYVKTGNTAIVINC